MNNERSLFIDPLSSFIEGDDRGFEEPVYEGCHVSGYSSAFMYRESSVKSNLNTMFHRDLWVQQSWLNNVTGKNALVKELCAWHRSKFSIIEKNTLSTGSPSRASHTLYSLSFNEVDYHTALQLVNHLDVLEESFYGPVAPWLREILREREELHGDSVRFLRSRERVYDLLACHYKVLSNRVTILWGDNYQALESPMSEPFSRVSDAFARVLDPREFSPIAGYLRALDEFNKWRKSAVMIPSEISHFGELDLGRVRKRGFTVEDMVFHRNLRELDGQLELLRENLEIEALMESLSDT